MSTQQIELPLVANVRPTLTQSVVSLFSGAGGLDQGLELSSWNVLAQVEMEADCASTLRHRSLRQGKDTLIVQRKIEDVSPQALRDRLGIGKGDLDLLAGGPPCQPFTTSGLRMAMNDRRASSLFPAYLEFVREFDPKALLIENVDGMLSAALKHRPLSARGKGHPELSSEEQKGSFLKWFLGELTHQGYAVAWGVVEAADYGVPQMRQRAILIGVKGTDPCFLPAPTFGREGLPAYRDLAWALRDITDLGGIQPLSQRKKDVYSQVPAGGNWRDLPEEVCRQTMGAAFIAQGGKSGWWRRLAWNEPAPTVLGMPDHSSTALVHPDELRCLSVNECAAVQSFRPDTFFAGTSRSQYQQIGNAVPPLLGRALGEHIKDFLKGKNLTQPSQASWRKLSSNRRIGTHGWAVPNGSSVEFHMNVLVRPDHVWAESLFQDLYV